MNIKYLLIIIPIIALASAALLLQKNNIIDKLNTQSQQTQKEIEESNKSKNNDDILNKLLEAFKSIETGESEGTITTEIKNTAEGTSATTNVEFTAVTDASQKDNLKGKSLVNVSYKILTKQGNLSFDSKAEVIQIGNSLYIKEGNGEWKKTDLSKYNNAYKDFGDINSLSNLRQFYNVEGKIIQITKDNKEYYKVLLRPKKEYLEDISSKIQEQNGNIDRELVKKLMDGQIEILARKDTLLPYQMKFSNSVKQQGMQINMEINVLFKNINKEIPEIKAPESFIEFEG